MGYSNFHVAAAVIFLSFLVSVTTAEASYDLSSPVVPDVSDIVAVLMYNSDLSGTKNRGTVLPQHLVPHRGPENSFIPAADIGGPNSDSDGQSDNITEEQTKNGHRYYTPVLFNKRGLYGPDRLNFFKRSSLNELIRRLMALRGHSFTDGRASMMRFGAGRRK